MNVFLKPCWSQLIALFVSASLSILSCIIVSSSLITWLVSDTGLKLLHLFRGPFFVDWYYICIPSILWYLACLYGFIKYIGWRNINI